MKKHHNSFKIMRKHAKITPNHPTKILKSRRVLYSHAAEREHTSPWSESLDVPLQDLAVFRLQYFSCLPLKISSSEFHSILKMISASRRIFFVILPICCPQYFSCLPLKISSYEFHSILKMISASRRIFF